MKTQNITYLLGAGASYFACPIWKEQGEKMIELAEKYINLSEVDFIEQKPNNLLDGQSILWDIGYFGHKALEFGTIDTYAKKLLINQSIRELQRLKLAVSVFFTLWESSNDTIKNRNGAPFKSVDSRYISLLSSIIESSNGNPKLKENVRFVTWNYDLQLERAFKAFCIDHLDWNDISSNLSFRVNPQKNERKLEVCHLNGYNGFYNTTENNKQEIGFLDRSTSNEIKEIINDIQFMNLSMSREMIKIHDHINYAWENSTFSKYTREQALSIFHETDILVIIGYSFPSFNKEIDKSLFEQLAGRETKIYYQDPYASEDLLKVYTQGLKTKLHLIKDYKDHFFLPPEF
jgi:hypothetical protein